MQSDVISIQHATTVFTQPALSGFTNQASIFWILDTQLSVYERCMYNLLLAIPLQSILHPSLSLSLIEDY